VHAVISPSGGYTLAGILHSWKSFTASAANKLLGRVGEFWMPDYFDRYIRDDTHLQTTLEYIRQNPVKAGLVQNSDDWPWQGTRASSPQSGQDGRAPGSSCRRAGGPSRAHTAIPVTAARNTNPSNVPRSCLVMECPLLPGRAVLSTCFLTAPPARTARLLRSPLPTQPHGGPFPRS